MLAALCLCIALPLAGYTAFKFIQRRQLERFRQITPTMDSWQVERHCGKPDRTWGSGFLRYEYDIIGGGTVTITFYGMEPGSVVYDDEVLFERKFPPPAAPYTHSMPSKPRPISPEGLKTLQAKPPPKRSVPEP